MLITKEQMKEIAKKIKDNIDFDLLKQKAEEAKGIKPKK